MFRRPIIEVSSPLPAVRPERYTDPMTVAARVRQADLRRVLKEARRIGAKQVRVGADGVIDILISDGDMAGPLASDQNEPGPIRICLHAKKRMDF